MKPSRIVLLALAALYITEIVLVPHAEASFWKERSASIQKLSLPSPAAPSLPVSPLTHRVANPALQSILDSLPLSQVIVQDVYDPVGSAQKPIVLLQDVHLNSEAQGHLAGALESLINKDAVSFVGVEGAFTKFDFAPYRSLPDAASVRETATALMDRNVLAAPSVAGLRAKKSPVMQGVDHPEHYAANVQAYRQARGRQVATRRNLEKAATLIDQEKAAVLSDPLRSLDALRTAYRSGALEMGAYISALSKIGALHQVPLSAPLRDFLAAYRLEKEIDLKAVESQKRAVLDLLVSKLNETEVKTLFAESAAYRLGRLHIGEFYRRFEITCRAKGIDLSTVPEFKAYVAYAALVDRLSVAEIMKGLSGLEAALIRSLKPTRSELAVWERSEQNALARKLVDFSLTHEEWKAYAAHPPLAAFESFYREADRRSHAMLQNLLSQRRGRPSAMVIGGYHTADFVAALKENKIPYVVASPLLTKLDSTGGTEYLTSFAREKTPLETLIRSEKLFLAPNDRNISDAATALRTLAQTGLDQVEQNPLAQFSAASRIQRVGPGLLQLLGTRLFASRAPSEHLDPSLSLAVVEQLPLGGHLFSRRAASGQAGYSRRSVLLSLAGASVMGAGIIGGLRAMRMNRRRRAVDGFMRAFLPQTKEGFRSAVRLAANYLHAVGSADAPAVDEYLRFIATDDKIELITGAAGYWGKVSDEGTGLVTVIANLHKIGNTIANIQQSESEAYFVAEWVAIAVREAKGLQLVRSNPRRLKPVFDLHNSIKKQRDELFLEVETVDGIMAMLFGQEFFEDLHQQRFLKTAVEKKWLSLDDLDRAAPQFEAQRNRNLVSPSLQDEAEFFRVTFVERLLAWIRQERAGVTNTDVALARVYLELQAARYEQRDRRWGIRRDLLEKLRSDNLSPDEANQATTAVRRLANELYPQVKTLLEKWNQEMREGPKAAAKKSRSLFVAAMIWLATLLPAFGQTPISPNPAVPINQPTMVTNGAPTLKWERYENGLKIGDHTPSESEREAAERVANRFINALDTIVTDMKRTQDPALNAVVEFREVLKRELIIVKEKPDIIPPVAGTKVSIDPGSSVQDPRLKIDLIVDLDLFEHFLNRFEDPFSRQMMTSVIVKEGATILDARLLRPQFHADELSLVRGYRGKGYLNVKDPDVRELAKAYIAHWTEGEAVGYRAQRDYLVRQKLTPATFEAKTKMDPKVTYSNLGNLCYTLLKESPDNSPESNLKLNVFVFFTHIAKLDPFTERMVRDIAYLDGVRPTNGDISSDKDAANVVRFISDSKYLDSAYLNAIGKRIAARGITVGAAAPIPFPNTNQPSVVTNGVPPGAFPPGFEPWKIVSEADKPLVDRYVRLTQAAKQRVESLPLHPMQKKSLMALFDRVIQERRLVPVATQGPFANTAALAMDDFIALSRQYSMSDEETIPILAHETVHLSPAQRKRKHFVQDNMDAIFRNQLRYFDGDAQSISNQITLKQVLAMSAWNETEAYLPEIEIRRNMAREKGLSLPDYYADLAKNATHPGLKMTYETFSDVFGDRVPMFAGMTIEQKLCVLVISPRLTQNVSAALQRLYVIERSPGQSYSAWLGATLTDPQYNGREIYPVEPQAEAPKSDYKKEIVAGILALTVAVAGFFGFKQWRAKKSRLSLFFIIFFLSAQSVFAQFNPAAAGTVAAVSSGQYAFAALTVIGLVLLVWGFRRSKDSKVSMKKNQARSISRRGFFKSLGGALTVIGAIGLARPAKKARGVYIYFGIHIRNHFESARKFFQDAVDGSEKVIFFVEATHVAQLVEMMVLSYWRSIGISKNEVSTEDIRALLAAYRTDPATKFRIDQGYRRAKDRLSLNEFRDQIAMMKESDAKVFQRDLLKFLTDNKIETIVHERLDFEQRLELLLMDRIRQEMFVAMGEGRLDQALNKYSEWMELFEKSCSRRDDRLNSQLKGLIAQEPDATILHLRGQYHLKNQAGIEEGIAEIKSDSAPFILGEFLDAPLTLTDPIKKDRALAISFIANILFEPLADMSQPEQKEFGDRLGKALEPFQTRQELATYLRELTDEATKLATQQKIKATQALFMVLRQRNIISQTIYEKGWRGAGVTPVQNPTVAKALRAQKLAGSHKAVLVAIFFVLTSIPNLFAQFNPAAPMTSLNDWVEFIKFQRVQPGQQSDPIPPIYYVPTNLTTGYFRDTAHKAVIDQAVGLYDSSLAVMGLLKTGNVEDLAEAEDILQRWARGSYGNMALRAFPSIANGHAFQPFTTETYYLFNLTKKSGVFDSAWGQFNAFTGPNAWMVMAVAEYMRVKNALGQTPDPSVVEMGNAIARAMLLLQTDEGAIRFGPRGQSGGSEPDWAWNLIAMEHQESAFAALNAMYVQTGNVAYKNAADRIWEYVTSATIYTAGGVAQTGLLRREGSNVYFVKAVDFNPTNGRWEIEPQIVTDVVSWGIQSFSPERIDAAFGDGTSAEMYFTIRRNNGWFISSVGPPMTFARPTTLNSRLDGFDTVNMAPNNTPTLTTRGMLLREWSDPGLARVLHDYYLHQRMFRTYALPLDQLATFMADFSSIKATMNTAPNGNAYGFGPALTSSQRQGDTYLGWRVPLSALVRALSAGLEFLEGPMINSQLPNIITTNSTLPFLRLVRQYSETFKHWGYAVTISELAQHASMGRSVTTNGNMVYTAAINDGESVAFLSRSRTAAGAVTNTQSFVFGPTNTAVTIFDQGQTVTWSYEGPNPLTGVIVSPPSTNGPGSIFILSNDDFETQAEMNLGPLFKKGPIRIWPPEQAAPPAPAPKVKMLRQRQAQAGAPDRRSLVASIRRLIQPSEKMGIGTTTSDRPAVRPASVEELAADLRMDPRDLIRSVNDLFTESRFNERPSVAVYASHADEAAESVRSIFVQAASPVDVVIVLKDLSETDVRNALGEAAARVRFEFHDRHSDVLDFVEDQKGGDAPLSKWTFVVTPSFPIPPGYFDLSGRALTDGDRQRILAQISVILMLAEGAAAELTGRLLNDVEAARQALIAA